MTASLVLDLFPCSGLVTWLLTFVIFVRLRFQESFDGQLTYGWAHFNHWRRQCSSQYDGTKCGFPGGHEERSGHRLLGGGLHRHGSSAGAPRVCHLHHRSLHRHPRVSRRLWHHFCFDRPNPVLPLRFHLKLQHLTPFASGLNFIRFISFERSLKRLISSFIHVRQMLAFRWLFTEAFVFISMPFSSTVAFQRFISFLRLPPSSGNFNW